MAKSSVRLTPTGCPVPGRPLRTQTIQAQCVQCSTWLVVASTVPAAWHSVTFPFLLSWEPARLIWEATSGHRLSTKIKRWEWERCRSASCPTSTRQIGHTLYLLHSECADGGPVNLQNAVPRMDGIAVVSTNVHPVYSKTQELREGEDLLKTHPNNSAFSGNTHQIPGPDHPHKKRRHHS